MTLAFNIKKLCGLSRCLFAASLISTFSISARFVNGQVPADSQIEASSPMTERLPPGFMDSTAADTAAGRDTRTKSPGGALLRAIVLPGWGQFYTGHPVRGTVAAVLETAFFAGAISKYRDRSRLRDELRELEKTAPVEDPGRVELNARIKTLGQQGGDYLAYGLTTLLLSVIDSYVSAHLHRFDRNFQVQVNPGTVRLCYRF
jgi:hypothetical protein